MAKTSTLNTLVDLAQDQTDIAARELGKLQALRTQAEQQLTALTQYREEYRQRMQALMRDGMTSSRWHDFSQFLDSLDLAIRQQGEALARAEAQLLAGRANWQQQKRKLNSYDTLVTRAEAREQKVADRRDQRNMDEFAARAARMQLVAKH